MDFLCCCQVARLAYFRILHNDATFYSGTTPLNIQAAVNHLQAHIRDPHATSDVRTTLANVQACCFDDKATGDVDTVSLDLQCAGQGCRPGRTVNRQQRPSLPLASL